MPTQNIGGLEITAPLNPGYADILTPDACRFVADLERMTKLAIAVHTAPRMCHRNVPQITRNVK